MTRCASFVRWRCIDRRVVEARTAAAVASTPREDRLRPLSRPARRGSTRRARATDRRSSYSARSSSSGRSRASASTRSTPTPPRDAWPAGWSTGRRARRLPPHALRRRPSWDARLAAGAPSGRRGRRDDDRDGGRPCNVAPRPPAADAARRDRRRAAEPALGCGSTTDDAPPPTHHARDALRARGGSRASSPSTDGWRRACTSTRSAWTRRSGHRAVRRSAASSRSATTATATGRRWSRAASSIDAEIRILTRHPRPCSPAAQHPLGAGGLAPPPAERRRRARGVPRRRPSSSFRSRTCPQPSGQSVTLQASACARPVVLSRTRGLWDPDRLRDGENVLLVPPGRPRRARGCGRTGAVGRWPRAMPSGRAGAGDDGGDGERRALRRACSSRSASEALARP